MTLRDKLRHILHPGSKKNSPKSPTSASPSASASLVAKLDPNKPPNARDPGFRKSFNLGETDSSPVTSPRDIAFNRSESQNVAAIGNDKMYTLDQYDNDYLAVSPRTNITVPDSAGADGNPSPFDEGAKLKAAALDQDTKADSTAYDAARAVGEPSAGRDKKDSTFEDPALTRGATTTTYPPKSGDNAIFALESPPQDTTGTALPQPTPAPVYGENKRISYLLALPKPDAEDGASSIYSDDSSRPPLQQVDSNIDSLPRDSPILAPFMPPTATAHQQRYTLLVSDVLPNAEGLDALKAAFNRPDDLPEVTIESPSHARFLDTAPSIPEFSIDQQAEAFSDIVAAHLAYLQVSNKGLESRDVPNGIPDVSVAVDRFTNGAAIAEAESMYNTPSDMAVSGKARPPLVHDDSVYAITKELPGAF